MARLWIDCIAIGVFLGIILLMINLHHSLLIGDLSFIIMTLISTIDKAWSLGQNWCDLQSAISILNNHKWLTRVKNMAKRIENSNLASTEIRIKNLSFTYNQKEFIFWDLSLFIPSAHIIGIMGKPGSGKSTLMQILFGTLSPCSGSICLTTQRNIAQRGAYMHFIAQEPDLFLNLDVQSNLMLVKDNINIKDIHAALALAHAHHLQLNTLVKFLSGGQKQQLCIARAFLDEKPIWLLDEALSALDENTHRIIMKNILDHPKIKKIIMISHQSRDHDLYQVNIDVTSVNTTHYLVSSET